jgi:hypothetical protein
MITACIVVSVAFGQLLKDDHICSHAANATLRTEEKQSI